MVANRSGPEIDHRTGRHARRRAADAICAVGCLASRPDAAVGVELPDGAAPYDRVTFTARADRPMRVSVRFRSLGPPAEHWQRSVYVDETPRDHTIRFDDVTPVDAARAPHPDPRDIHDILFVVETTNSSPGSAGQLWMRNVRLQR